MPKNGLAHPYPPPVVQVDHVPGRLRLSPLGELVGLDGGQGPTIKSSPRGSHAEPMEGRSAYSAILSVKELDPGI